MLGIPAVEWFGYFASIVVAISLTMSSIVKLRWLNMFGAAVFSAYGFIIGALPVALLNLFIVFANIYYLRRIYTQTSHYRLLEVTSDSHYLNFFVENYKSEIKSIFPHFDQNSLAQSPLCFLMLKEAVPIGVFVGYVDEQGQMEIYLDFVMPEYRDFKIGKYLYQNRDFFAEHEIQSLSAVSGDPRHSKYLSQMGFSLDSNDTWSRTI